MTQGSGAIRIIGVDAAVHCPACGATVQLAGPVLQARCHGCRAEIPIVQALWLQTLAEADEQSFDAGSTRTVTGACRREQRGVHLLVEWSHSEPTCRRCGAFVPQVEPGTSGEIPCPGCQAPMPTFTAPPWMRSEIPTALQVYGVEYVFDAAALDVMARRWWIAFQGTPTRKAHAQQMFIEQEIVVMSQRMPQKKQSSAYIVPLLLAFVLIGMAAYYVVNSLNRNSDDEILDISE
jgi:hypothetical protein